MNTILTDDERRSIIKSWDFGALAGLIEATEAAVLAKLREQEPVAWNPAGHFYNLVAHALMDIGANNDGAIFRLKEILKELEALEAAPLPAVVQVTPGYKLVPVEPTPEMIHAGRYGGDEDAPPMGSRPVEGETAWPFCSPLVAAKIYRAMLAAAPEAPAQEKSNG